MTAGDPFVNGFTTSGTVAIAPIGHNVMLTSIMCSSQNGRIDLGGGYYTVMQGFFGSSPSSSTSLADWSGSPLLNMKLVMTPWFD